MPFATIRSELANTNSTDLRFAPMPAPNTQVASTPVRMSGHGLGMVSPAATPAQLFSPKTVKNSFGSNPKALA